MDRQGVLPLERQGPSSIMESVPEVAAYEGNGPLLQMLWLSGQPWWVWEGDPWSWDEGRHPGQAH